MSDGSSPVLGPLTRTLTPVSGSFNRPADIDAYTANDLIANSATAGSVVPLSFSSYWGRGTIRRIKVRKSNQAVATPTIRVYLFTAAPTSAAGDNTAFSATQADGLGIVDVDVTTPGTDDAVGWAACDIPYVAETVYALLRAEDTFTPASEETFTVELTEYPG